MHCPHCAVDINDDQPECAACGFHIRDLDAVFGEAPVRDGPLLDAAGLLGDGDVERLLERLRSFHAATGCEFVVHTVAETAPRLPAEYAFWVFNHWKVGGEGHRGLLILVARQERRIEVEVGHALEGILSDAASARVLEEEAVPFFRQERYAEGLQHACHLLGCVFENALRAGAAGEA